MPNETIDNSLVIEFSEMVHELAQQIRSRLRPFAKIVPMKGDYRAYDGLGEVEARKVDGRIVKADFDSIEHLRRKISRERFMINLPIDQKDVRARLMDPDGDYARACVKAFERNFDRVCYDAMFADVYTGREMNTTVTFAQDGGRTVTATSGLVYEKLLEIKRNWTDDEVGNDFPVKMCLGITGDEEEDLMLETELTSGDFTNQYVVDKGRVTQALSMDVVKFGANVKKPIIKEPSNRECFAMAENAICVGLSKEMSLKIEPRPDYVELRQVQIIMELGAVRTEGKLIQKVVTTP